ncbi:MAG: S8 family serine peptidase [Bacteroidia bacterium]|nr:S8 family serine peptidase [Bacteroidia bacterium]MDW8235564.1 S8 family serine peptidase [Bacteroidia bacterium]
MRRFLLGALLWAQESVWPGRVLFKLNEGYSLVAPPVELRQIQETVKGRIKPRFPSLPSSRPIYLLEYESGFPPPYVAKLLRRSPAVGYAEPEFIPQPVGPLQEITYTPNDLHANNYALSHLRVLEAWDSTYGDTSYVVAVVDTDVRFDHPDLVENVAYNWNDPINGIDDDGDGYVDNFHGWDIVGNSYTGSGPFNPDNDPRTPSPGHGTWVAGFAAATTNNGIGIAAPAFRCRYLPIKAAPNGSSALYGAYDGVLYAAQRGAHVVNCSWGGTYWSQAAQDFIQQVVDTYDPLIVAAAGNVLPDTPAVFYPAQYPGVVAVTAVFTNDVWLNEVQIGYGMDLATTGRGRTTSGLNGYTDWTWRAFTSFASPQAAGCAVLLRSWRPTLNAYQIAELLRITADSLEGVNPPALHYRIGRRINLLRAIQTRDTPACRVIIWQAYDSNDSLFFSGEQISILPTYRNFLSPVSGLIASVHPLTPHLQAVAGHNSYNIGSLSTLATHAQLSNQPFKLAVQPSCPIHATLPVMIRWQGSGGYRDYQVIEIGPINPAYVHLDSAQVRTTACGNGRVGYYDTPRNQQGRGVRWQGEPSWLYEGGFFIADDTSAHLCTRSNSFNPYQHFKPTALPQKSIQGLYEKALLTFQDTGGTRGAKGFEIKLHAYAPRLSPLDSFVAFVYELHNPTGISYADLSVGWWMDFDVGNNPARDAAGSVPGIPLLYAKDEHGHRWIGVVLLSSKHTPHLHAGRTYLFGGTPFAYLRTIRDSTGTEITQSDVFLVVDARGVNLPAGGRDTVALALIGGSSLSALIQQAQVARQWYACFIENKGPVVDLGPDRIFCVGDSLAPDVPGAVAYYWSTGANTPAIYPQQSGAYELLVRDAMGCWGYDAVLLDVRSLSAAQVSFSPGLSLQVGQALIGQEISGAPYTFTWKVQTSSGWNTYVGASFSHTFSQAGTYTIWLYRLDPLSGCQDSLSWQVVVSPTSAVVINPLPTIQIYPNPTADAFLIDHDGSVEGKVLEFYDMTGQCVWKAPVLASGSIYHLPAFLSGGLYEWRIGILRGSLLLLR